MLLKDKIKMTVLADLRKQDDDGSTGFIKLAIKGEFDKVVEIARKESTDYIKISDVTHRNDMQVDVLLALGFGENLVQLFDASLWCNRTEDMIKIKEKLSEHFQEQVDFPTVINEINVMVVKKKESHRTLKRRPRP